MNKTAAAEPSYKDGHTECTESTYFMPLLLNRVAPPVLHHLNVQGHFK